MDGKDYYFKITLPDKSEITFKYKHGNHSAGTIVDTLAREWLLTGKTDYRVFEK